MGERREERREERGREREERRKITGTPRVPTKRVGRRGEELLKREGERKEVMREASIPRRKKFLERKARTEEGEGERDAGGEGAEPPPLTVLAISTMSTVSPPHLRSPNLPPFPFPSPPPLSEITERLAVAGEGGGKEEPVARRRGRRRRRR